MIISFRALVCRAGLLLTLLTASSRGAVTFSISPSTVSIAYSGTITLQVAGLTNTESVVIQKFLDANTNGTVDAADSLVQQFQLKDGQASVIRGVTNLNVPGDLDSATGQITAPSVFIPLWTLKHNSTKNTHAACTHSLSTHSRQGRLGP